MRSHRPSAAPSPLMATFLAEERPEPNDLFVNPNDPVFDRVSVWLDGVTEDPALLRQQNFEAYGVATSSKTPSDDDDDKVSCFDSESSWVGVTKRNNTAPNGSPVVRKSEFTEVNVRPPRSHAAFVARINKDLEKVVDGHVKAGADSKIVVRVRRAAEKQSLRLDAPKIDSNYVRKTYLGRNLTEEDPLTIITSPTDARQDLTRTFQRMAVTKEENGPAEVVSKSRFPTPFATKLPQASPLKVVSKSIISTPFVNRLVPVTVQTPHNSTATVSQQQPKSKHNAPNSPANKNLFCIIHNQVDDDVFQTVQATLAIHHNTAQEQADIRRRELDGRLDEIREQRDFYCQRVETRLHPWRLRLVHGTVSLAKFRQVVATEKESAEGSIRILDQEAELLRDELDNLPQ